MHWKNAIYLGVVIAIVLILAAVVGKKSSADVIDQYVEPQTVVINGQVIPIKKMSPVKYGFMTDQDFKLIVNDEEVVVIAHGFAKGSDIQENYPSDFVLISYGLEDECMATFNRNSLKIFKQECSDENRLIKSIKIEHK